MKHIFDLWSPVQDFTEDTREWCHEVVISKDEALDWIARGYALSQGEWVEENSWPNDEVWLESRADVEAFFAE